MKELTFQSRRGASARLRKDDHGLDPEMAISGLFDFASCEWGSRKDGRRVAEGPLARVEVKGKTIDALVEPRQRDTAEVRAFFAEQEAAKKAETEGAFQDRAHQHWTYLDCYAGMDYSTYFMLDDRLGVEENIFCATEAMTREKDIDGTPAYSPEYIEKRATEVVSEWFVERARAQEEKEGREEDRKEMTVEILKEGVFQNEEPDPYAEVRVTDPQTGEFGVFLCRNIFDVGYGVNRIGEGGGLPIRKNGEWIWSRHEEEDVPMSDFEVRAVDYLNRFPPISKSIRM